jgi:hypothetical protein
MNGTGSGLCPVVGFLISNAKVLSSSITELHLICVKLF